jgi:hypothetical protein
MKLRAKMASLDFDALVLAFPALHVKSFSGFYLPLMVVLWYSWGVLSAKNILTEQRANSPKPALKYNSKPFWASLYSAWFSRHIGRRQPLRVQR